MAVVAVASPHRRRRKPKPAPATTQTSLPPDAASVSASATCVRASKHCSKGLDLVFRAHGDVRTTAVARPDHGAGVVSVGLAVPDGATAQLWAYDDGRRVEYGCIEDSSNPCSPTTGTASPAG
ncbi:hypothetical protein GCM10025864_10710 [Luteimicrobium album]|uniref:Anti-sigma K factor RskA C-terminal domain-containing protein n=1 Tax=Luteimicrobium album TaxID=1054550 RepID=A0ABQ6HZB5_9MICO|nr:hypothetical protein [Luteimicrobium album]GMA23312.1 hypothetical protein GCM10025864_10710 [Luteimicrobium album]